MIKNILIDLDDTILDFKKCERVALGKALTELSIAHNEDTIKRYSEINDMHWKMLERGEITRSEVLLGRFERLFEEIGADCSGDLAWKTYEEMLGGQCYFVDGAIDLLKELSERYNLYIVSNGTATVQDKRIELADISKYFKNIFISQRIGVNKPDVRFFEACFGEIEDFKKEETIIIGDSLSSDIKGGNNAGIRTVWYNPNCANNKTDAKVDFEIKTLDKIKEILCCYL